MEYFDILDENGNKTGKTKLRQDVHRDGDWHKSIMIFIINNKHEVILQKRSANKDSDPNMWTASASGHLSAGDSSSNAAIRELEEELGIKVDKEELKYLFTVKEQKVPKPGFIDNEIVDVYLINSDINIEDLTIQKEEVSEVRWIHLNEFKHMVRDKDKTLVKHDEIYNRLFEILDRE